jgi:hypothetical protein
VTRGAFATRRANKTGSGLPGVSIPCSPESRPSAWSQGGGYEYKLVLIAVAVALALVGPGPISVANALGVADAAVLALFFKRLRCAEAFSPRCTVLA